MWFLVGPFDSAETVRHMPIYTFPFLIGRRQDLPLSLSCKTVSTVHAEITEVGRALVIRDLGSTNGTYVNGRRVKEPVTLPKTTWCSSPTCLSASACNRPEDSPHTVRESACDRALALVLFDKLMAEHAVTPFLQPIIDLKGRKTLAYEVLARSRLFGLETPKDMFGVAQQLNLEVELSTMLRWEGVQVTQAMSAVAALVPQHASPRVARSEARPVAGALARELARPGR